MLLLVLGSSGLVVLHKGSGAHANRPTGPRVGKLKTSNQATLNPKPQTLNAKPLNRKPLKPNPWTANLELRTSSHTCGTPPKYPSEKSQELVVSADDINPA